MKTLTNEQMAALQPYEQYFETAIKADWSRYPGIPALSVMYGILAAVSNGVVKPNYNCQSCVLRLLKDVGGMYYATKESTPVVVEEAPAQTIEKVVVKTRKRKVTQ